MPDFAYLRAAVPCLTCGRREEELFAFAWGWCPGQNVYPETTYRIGDRIRWRVCNGRVAASSALPPDGHSNVGDPRIERVVVAGSSGPGWYKAPGVCPSCGSKDGGIRIEIDHGTIAGAWRIPWTTAVVEHRSFTWDRHGRRLERADWADLPGARVESCAEAELTLLDDVPASLVDAAEGIVARRTAADEGYGAAPRYAFFADDLACPLCGARRGWDETYAFWWGYVCDLRASTALKYHVGASIRWRSCGASWPPAWARFADGQGMNAGDPQIPGLIAMAGDPLRFRLPDYCAACHMELGGTAIEIEDGMIVSARRFRVGEFDPLTYDHYTVEPDGSLVPHAAATNQPFDEVECAADG